MVHSLWHFWVAHVPIKHNKYWSRVARNCNVYQFCTLYSIFLDSKIKFNMCFKCLNRNLWGHYNSHNKTNFFFLNYCLNACKKFSYLMLHVFCIGFYLLILLLIKTLDPLLVAVSIHRGVVLWNLVSFDLFCFEIWSILSPKNDLENNDSLTFTESNMHIERNEHNSFETVFFFL